MRLDIRVVGAKERLGPRDRGALDDVNEFAAAVVPPARIPFGVLVGQDRAGRLEDGAADEVFRRNQFDAVVLAGALVADRLGDLWVRLRQRAEQEAGGLGGHLSQVRRSASAIWSRRR